MHLQLFCLFVLYCANTSRLIPFAQNFENVHILIPHNYFQNKRMISDIGRGDFQSFRSCRAGLLKLWVATPFGVAKQIGLTNQI